MPFPSRTTEARVASSNGLYLGWGRSSAWGEALAADLGVPAAFSREGGPPAKRSPRWGPLAYWGDLRWTLRMVREVRPTLLIWQVPPSIGPILIHGGGPFTRLTWGLDVHSGAVNLARWKWLLPGLRRTARTAAFTVVHNAEIGAMIDPWPSPVVIVDNYVVPLAERPESIARTFEGPIVVTASGAVDEPLWVVSKAAALLGDEYRFVVTGRESAVRRRFGDFPLPPTVRLTGFLSRADYVQLLSTASIVVCLTTRPATMQLGAWEALSLGRPVIVSDQAVLRANFREGAEFATPDPESLIACIRGIRARYQDYLASSARMEVRMRRDRVHQIGRLREYLPP